MSEPIKSIKFLLAISSASLFEFSVVEKVFDITRSYDKTILVLKYMTDNSCDYETALKNMPRGL